MSESNAENFITLKPHAYGKLGSIHCGVTYEGFVAVGGYPRDIADGEELLFEKIGVKARRSGSDYTFTKIE